MAKRVKCEICGKRLHGQGFLNRHYKTIHKDKLDLKTKPKQVLGESSNCNVILTE